MLMNDYKAVSPEIQIRNTIADLKADLRTLNEEMARYNENYHKNMKMFEDKKVEYSNNIDAWTKILENFKNVRG